MSHVSGFVLEKTYAVELRDGEHGGVGGALQIGGGSHTAWTAGDTRSVQMQLSRLGTLPAPWTTRPVSMLAAVPVVSPASARRRKLPQPSAQLAGNSPLKKPGRGLAA